jgi:hypothetical protein
MAMVTVEHETLFARLDIGKCLPGEHFVELHPLDYWELDIRKRMRLTFWFSCRLGGRGQLSDDRRCHSDAQAPRYLDLSSWCTVMRTYP